MCRRFNPGWDHHLSKTDLEKSKSFFIPGGFMKKVTVYFTRHGETYFNVLKRTQGWCDSPLTELGIKQAKALGLGLKHIPFDRIYSSTSERAIDTASYMMEMMEYEEDLYLNKGLKEFFFGTLEGQDESTLKYEDYVTRNLKNREVGGENVDDLVERYTNTMNDILDDCNDGDTILIVAHSACLAYYVSQLEKDFHDNYVFFSGFGNCTVHKVEYIDSVPHILEYGNNDYLKNGLQKLEM